MATKQQELETTLAAVDSVQPRTAQDGQRYWLVVAGGRRYYCWDGRLASQLQAGSTYELAFVPGKFPRLRQVRQATASNGLGAQDGASPNIGTAQASSQERLEALRLVLTLAQWTRLESVDQALQAADKVLAWLKGARGDDHPHH